MYHSITFGDKNTWNDWCLIPETEPIIAPPSQKTNFIDIPGADGSLDMSEVLTGYPIYNDREGTLSFIAMNKNASSTPECNPFKFRDLVATISDYLHGKKLKMVLEDDNEHYYEGRFYLESANADNAFNKIGIKYRVGPYKWTVKSTIDDWEWDPFNFETGVISSSVLKNIAVTTTQKAIHFTRTLIGSAPVVPKFVVSATNGQGIYIRIVNPNLGIDETKLFQNGTRINQDYVLYGDDITMYVWVSSGTGTLTINYRQGRL